MRRFALLFSLGLTLAAQPYPQSLFAELRWRMIGPFRVGRTPSVVGVPSQPDIFFVGVNNGGVWKTTDDCQTWNPDRTLATLEGSGGGRGRGAAQDGERLF